MNSNYANREVEDIDSETSDLEVPQDGERG